MSSLLQPVTLGHTIELRNRICMGAMTRNRCVNDNKPTDAAVKHYADRARDGAGLIVSEGIFICPTGSEYLHPPVMWDQSHAQAWKKVTTAVHQEGGKIFFQAWHAGRCQHDQVPMLKENNYPVLAPSEVPAAAGKYRFLEGAPGHTTNITEIKDPKTIIQQFKAAAGFAQDAGFDGIEILAQGGYLIHNFLCSHANKRTDAYGGSVENRCRFALEVVDAISEIWGHSAIGIKICPTHDANDSAVSYDELCETYDYLIKQLVSRELGYINLSRRGCALGKDENLFMSLDNHSYTPRSAANELPRGFEPLHRFGGLIKYPGSRTMLMVNHEYTVPEADALVKEGKIDLITFGRPFVYNPDVIARIKKEIPFATNDRGGHVYYGPYQDVNENYNDWPYAGENEP